MNDPDNRLPSGTSSAGMFSGLNLTWGYDSFGNRLQQTPSGATTASVPAAQTPTYSANSANNQVSSMAYNAGNLTDDGENKYLYDAEDRICAVNRYKLGVGIVGYLYDPMGHRVSKGTLATFNCNSSSAGYQLTPTNLYAVGLNGEQLDEGSGSGSLIHSNVFQGGKLLATFSATDLNWHYALNDWLGTKRVQVAASEATDETCTSLPFGDELNCQGPGTDATEHHFTGKERDSESGLDYFGARYYGSNMGRFMSPDPGWFFASRLENPQTWNQYSYALNNPLTNTDPDGYDCVYLNDSGTGAESVDANSSSGECGSTGGYYVDGTATKLTTYSNSNDVALSGQVGGNQLGQGQSTDAFYSSVYANQNNANLQTVDVSDTSTLMEYSYGTYLPNIRSSTYPYPTRMFGTHYCGPGRGGVPVNALDAACKAHDACYAAAGISAANNTGGAGMTLQQAAAAQACNAALGAAAAAHPGINGSTRVLLILMGLLTLYELVILYFIDYAALSAKPGGMPLAWFLAICKIVGLMVSRKTGLLLLAFGVLDWIVTIGVFQMRDLHVSLIVAVEHSSLDATFVVFALMYVFFQRRGSTA